MFDQLGLLTDSVQVRFRLNLARYESVSFGYDVKDAIRFVR